MFCTKEINGEIYRLNTIRGFTRVKHIKTGAYVAKIPCGGWDGDKKIPNPDFNETLNEEVEKFELMLKTNTIPDWMLK